MTMRIKLRLPKHVTAALLALTRFTIPAHAFRCGTKIVAKDMHEAQARQACGAPTTMRNINMPIETLGYGYRESVDYAA